MDHPLFDGKELSEPRRSPLGEKHPPLRSALAASDRRLTQLLTNYNTREQLLQDQPVLTCRVSRRLEVNKWHIHGAQVLHVVRTAFRHNPHSSGPVPLDTRPLGLAARGFPRRQILGNPRPPGVTSPKKPTTHSENTNRGRPGLRPRRRERWGPEMGVVLVERSVPRNMGPGRLKEFSQGMCETRSLNRKTQRMLSASHLAKVRGPGLKRACNSRNPGPLNMHTHGIVAEKEGPES